MGHLLFKVLLKVKSTQKEDGPSQIEFAFLTNNF